MYFVSIYEFVCKCKANLYVRTMQVRIIHTNSYTRTKSYALYEFTYRLNFVEGIRIRMSYAYKFVCPYEFAYSM